MVCDPAGARNWFMIWARVTPDNKVYVYREWPDDSEGEWALPSAEPDGRMGTAQRSGAGRSLIEYKELINSLEKGEPIWARYIDPRAGGSKTITDDGGVTLIDMLDSGDNPMHFEPSAGVRIEQGVALINDGFSYDQTQTLNETNSPTLHISEECRNLIYCISEWTGRDGEKGATKDPVDCLRYLMVMEPIYTGGQKMNFVGGGSY
jgi:hypothetical protein